MGQKPFLVLPNKKIKLTDYDPGFTGKFRSKEEAKSKVRGDLEYLKQLQEVLWASNSHSLLIILQGMDTSGKGGIVEHVFSGINSMGSRAVGFKTPSAEELDHDYLWRCVKVLPEKGQITIFDRSYYEETLAVRVHPEFLQKQNLPFSSADDDIWQRRFREIKNFERYLASNGTVVVKFFLHISKAEQKERLLARIDEPSKNWKFSMGDIKERKLWERYMEAYEDAISQTSTEWAPWYVVPADHKWFARMVVADVVVSKLRSLELRYPVLSKEHQKELALAKKCLNGVDPA